MRGGQNAKPNKAAPGSCTRAEEMRHASQVAKPVVQTTAQPDESAYALGHAVNRRPQPWLTNLKRKTHRSRTSPTPWRLQSKTKSIASLTKWRGKPERGKTASTSNRALSQVVDLRAWHEEKAKITGDVQPSLN